MLERLDQIEIDCMRSVRLDRPKFAMRRAMIAAVSHQVKDGAVGRHSLPPGAPPSGPVLRGKGMRWRRCGLGRGIRDQGKRSQRRGVNPGAAHTFLAFELLERQKNTVDDAKSRIDDEANQTRAKEQKNNE